MSQPIEIIIPEHLAPLGTQDLRIGSKFLELLADSGLSSQNLQLYPEIFQVNSPVPSIRGFLEIVLRAGQFHEFLLQVKMLSHEAEDTDGLLICVVRQKFVGFAIKDKSSAAGIDWILERVI